MRKFTILLVVIPFLMAAAFHAVPAVSAPGERSAELPGVPLTQEQHHHLVAQNPYVNVYEVEVGPHDATLMHQHLHDYTCIVLGDADLTNAVAGKPEAKLQFADTTVNYSRGPSSHILANNGGTAFRNITIELLHPQGEMKNFYSSIKEALATNSPDGEGIRQVTVLETEEMRVVATGVAGGSSWSPVHDGRDRLVVMIDKVHDLSGPKEHNSPFPAGMLAWVPAGKTWSVANKSAKPMELMVLEFNDRLGQ